MKELSIEEKVQRYDEVIEKVKDALNDGTISSNTIAYLQDIFNELKESDDKRIIKRIIHALHGDVLDMEETNKAIAWLEKQCEQNHANSCKTCKDEPKFRVGDTIHKIGENTIFPMVIEEIKNGEYVCDNNHSFINIKFQDDYELVEQNPADKVEPKFKVGDTMRTLQEANDGYTDGMPVVVSIDDTSYHCTNETIDIKDQDDYEYPPINRKHNSWSEEVERIQLYTQSEVSEQVLDYIDEVQKEPVSDDLEDTTQTITYEGEVYIRCYKDKLDAFACKYPMSVPKTSKKYAKYSDVDLTIAVKEGAKWQKEQMMTNAADAVIGLPYENKDGGYTHLVDVSRPLPVGNNKIAIIFKED